MKSIEEWILYGVVAIFLLLFVLIVAIAAHIKHRREIDAQHDKAHKNLQVVADKTLALVADHPTPEGRSIENMRAQHSAETGKLEQLLTAVLAIVERIAKLLGITQKAEPQHQVPKTPPKDDTQ